MAFIAQNHFQFILEIAAIIFASMIFIINLVPLSLSIVTFLSLFLAIVFTLLFAGDIALLFLSFGQHEFTHTFGPIALLAIITALASLKIMERSGVNVQGLKRLVYILLALITLFGGMMHRSFLILWILGLFIGYLIISKSFREKSFLTIKRVLIFLGLGVAAFGLMELLAKVSGMQVFSPMLRINRLENNSLSSIQMVLHNTNLIGHVQNSSYWGSQGLGFADGYISLPMQFILLFGLPFPMFFGLLVSKKDIIDYMLPGTFGYAYDFGYLTMIALVAFVVITLIVGLKILQKYRDKRERKNKKYLGKEVLLIGSLTAFTTQALIGLFIFNRTINGTALLTFIVLASLVWGNVVTLKRSN
jgi:hypothetical protein